ncbi:MAG: hypothetical protein ACI4TX_02620, partial [Christensenellales bacterium]
NSNNNNLNNINNQNVNNDNVINGNENNNINNCVINDNQYVNQNNQNINNNNQFNCNQINNNANINNQKVNNDNAINGNVNNGNQINYGYRVLSEREINEFKKEFPNKFISNKFKVANDFDMTSLIVAVKKSDFLTNASNLGFSWLVNNYRAVLNGKYDNYLKSNVGNKSNIDDIMANLDKIYIGW